MDDPVTRREFELTRQMLDERYATQTKALDAAFTAQQAAMKTAFDAADKAVQAALLAAEKAVDKANTANEKRFESVNEFRGQLNDLVTTLISRAEAEARLQALDARLSEMKSTVDKSGAGDDATRSTTATNWGYLVGAVGIISVFVTLALMLAR